MSYQSPLSLLFASAERLAKAYPSLLEAARSRGLRTPAASGTPQYWDAWELYALCLGVEAPLARLGRDLLCHAREQHWPTALGFTARNGMALANQALHAPRETCLAWSMTLYRGMKAARLRRVETDVQDESAAA